ncbi:hypothetical protein EGV97_09385 [Helicobacter pylori]|uniref:Uncharacterized protein n=1 Tax=Helicobacter pylori TaxID=210 RepID=A0A7Z6UYY5_HELPX|nr:hypothetical protein [Helicobacter pylori]RPF66654.1 hypothetical protein EGV97_09385 [Helicobacter pylori]
MKNINLIKHFKKVENIKKRRLARSKANERILKLFKKKSYRDFIAKVKNKQQSDDEILEILEILPLGVEFVRPT